MYCHTWEPVPTKELPLQVLGREKQQGTEQSLGADTESRSYLSTSTVPLHHRPSTCL